MSGVKFAENVTKSPESIEKVRRAIEASAINDHTLEAAAHAEDILRWLRNAWEARGFTPEQCVFAVALATINLRESLPEKLGGKELFDRVAAEAKRYYDANK